MQSPLDYVARVACAAPFYHSRNEYKRTRFQDLPLLSKAQLRDGFPDAFTAALTPVKAWLSSGRLEILSTSGTGADKVRVLADTRLEPFPPNVRRLWSLDEHTSLKRVAVITGAECAGFSRSPTYEGRLRFGGQTLICATPTDFSEGREAAIAIIEDLWRFGPNFLFANPAYLLWLLREAQEMQRTIPPISIVVSAYQFAQRCTVSAIEAELACRVLGNYGASDLAGCQAAFQCHRGSFHVYEPHCHVEAVDANGEPHIDRMGRLAITTVGNDTYPIVRYLVGDIGIVRPSRCDCAMAGSPVLEIHGRVSEVVFAEGQYTTCRQLDEIVSSFQGIDIYRLVQHDASNAVLEIVRAPGSEPATSALARAVEERTRISRVTVRIHDHLSPERGPKYSTILSYSAGLWREMSPSPREIA